MGVFNNSKRIELGGLVDMSIVVDDVANNFKSKGYEVQTELLGTGGAHLSMTRSNMFKAVLGLKTALNVEIDPQSNGWAIQTSVGIFGQQVIPTIISLFFAWPVLLTQIRGLVKQAKLDDEAIAVIEESLKNYAIGTKTETPTNQIFCTQCGTKLQEDARFCMKCGFKLAID